MTSQTKTASQLQEDHPGRYESDSGPPVMPTFSTVPDCPSSDDEGAIQFRVALVHYHKFYQTLIFPCAGDEQKSQAAVAKAVADEAQQEIMKQLNFPEVEKVSKAPQLTPKVSKCLQKRITKFDEIASKFQGDLTDNQKTNLVLGKCVQHFLRTSCATTAGSQISYNNLLPQRP